MILVRDAPCRALLIINATISSFARRFLFWKDGFNYSSPFA
jgi:hypothetical protein